jgi:aspartate carbamoyltransferase catalytic subunit
MERHLRSIDELTAEDVAKILDTAEVFRAAGQRRKYPTLRGKTVCNLFFESSTRTRLSFELAAKRLSADVLNFSAGGSSVDKGESLKDTAQTIEAMGVDAIVLRHKASGAPWRLANWVDAKILNAGDGMHEHPSQALLDLFTMRRHHGRLDGLKVAIVGDIRHSRVAGSLIRALQLVGADPVLVSPNTLLPASVAAFDVPVEHELEQVLPKVDVCYLLRMQLERMEGGFVPSLREYSSLYGLDSSRAAMLPEASLIMHPGPMNRGVEIDGSAAELPRTVITEQVTNGINIRMALLYLMLGGKDATDEEALDA